MARIPTWMCVVAVALHDANDHWLMHRRPAHKHHGGLWEFPGGKVEDGENPAFALVREIHEELGLVLDPGCLHPVTFAEEPHGSSVRPVVILLYSASMPAGIPVALEGGEIGWFTQDQISELPRPPLDVALCERLFSGRST